MRSLKVCCRASADVCFKHFWRYLKKLSHFHSDWCPCALDLPCFPPARPSVLSSALRPTKYRGCRLRRRNPSKSSAYIYFFFLCFNMLSSHPHMLRHEHQTWCSATWSLFCPRWFTVRLLFTCSLVCPFVTSLFWCSAAQPRKLFHFMLPFVSIWEKKVAIGYCVCKVSLSPQCVTLFSEAKCFKNVDNMIIYRTLKYLLLPGGRAGSCHGRDVSYC